MKIGLLGYGYTASFFAHLMEASGHQVWGTSRNVSALKHSVPAGVEIIGFNHEEILRCMEGTTCFLISTPPNDSGHDSSFSIMKELILEEKNNCTGSVICPQQGCTVIIRVHGLMSLHNV